MFPSVAWRSAQASNAVRKYGPKRCMSTKSDEGAAGPLAGVKVVEVGNFIAGPHCATILAYYGAQVIKVEPPGGDQIRKFRDVDENGVSWWWRSIGRNKKSIVLDLKKAGAQDIVRDLCLDADVLLENFRPGKMEAWGLGPDDIRSLKPDIVYTRVSGYGQHGPYHKRPGFASACEAMGGFRYVNGFPDRESVRPNLSMGDTLAGVNAALGTVMALFALQKGNCKSSQVVDSSIYESVFGLMEGVLPDYDGAGIVREKSGSTVTGIVPTNTYPTKDGKSVVIGSNSDALFKRLMIAIGRQDIASDPKYSDNQKRVKHQKFLDGLIADWTRKMDSSQIINVVDDAQVPNGLIYSIEDIVNDPHYNSRGMIEEVDVPSLGRSLKIPGMSPKLSVNPGKTLFAGPELGEHTEEIVYDLLGYSSDKVDSLVATGCIEWPKKLDT
mmetsp:Transcript_9438/g.15425  ORF Transcript_9438/g.15425 Transcript_9438/m.15425 type:complete len:440 (+) Transcript_9438:31-1350(+)